MNPTARRLFFAALLAMLAASPAAAQVGDEFPRPGYYLGVQAFYAGQYRDAERALRSETRRGLRTTQARWIDAICHHAMLGEVLYHQGRNAEALAEFDQACQLLLAYPDWLLQVKFQSDTAGLRSDVNRARRMAPWGRSQRQFALAQLPSAEQVLVGRIDAVRAYQEGGVADFAMLLRVNVAEVVRTSALAIRRRNELLGPLAAHDRISRELSEVFARGNLAPANHWSRAWIDLLRGVAQAGVGKLDEADMLLGRSLVLEGQFDHRLTCVGLLEQGRLAMVRGDGPRAALLLGEAGFSAHTFENWDVLGEAVWLGWLNHLTSGGGGIYPPLEPAAAWTQANRLQHLAVRFRMAQAESLLWLGQPDAAAALLDDTGRRLGEMRGGLNGIHHVYLQAALQMLRGQLAPGAQTLTTAVAAQAGASPRNFQIARTNEMYDSRAVSPRVAVDLYAALLSDPAPADWLRGPLEAMAALQTPHDAAFDRWLVAALERKDVPLALDIADQTKRRRYLALRPLGGRLLALRTLLESPQAELSQEAALERQQLLTSFPAYRALAEAGRRMQHELRAGPILAGDPGETKTLAARYSNWATNINARQQLLAQLAVRRLPSRIEFPPRRTTPDLQQALGEGEALVVFHAAAGNLYGFLLTRTDIHIWQIADGRRLRGGVGDFLQAVGNFGSARSLTVPELSNDRWREAAKKAYTAVFADARLDLAKTTGLMIVPDDVLWYLPFEALIADDAQPETALMDRVAIRYGPTAALAVGSARPLRRPQRTGIVANQVADVVASEHELRQELEQVVAGPVWLSAPLPQPGHLVAPLLDGLIVLDDVPTDREITPGWSPLPRSRGTADDPLPAWSGLPHGGPERIVLTGFTTEAEQGLRGSRRTGRATAAARPGDELFLSLTGALAEGGRTILLTRWRTGGRTNFELVREFVRELPHGPATEAWQRACLLARESPLDSAREPRLKRSDETGELPTADHPFFWAGYLLVDTSPRPAQEKEFQSAENDQPPVAEKTDKGRAKGNKLPPPDGSGADDDAPAASGPAGVPTDTESR